MKQTAIFIISLLFTINAQAQNAEAQILFEEAEALYNEFSLLKSPNDDDFKKYFTPAIQKLNEVEKIVGEKPKTLYFRAIVVNKLIDMAKDEIYSVKDKENVLFLYVETARYASKTYMELKKNDEVDDRYREMRQLYSEMQKYPKTKEEWQTVKERFPAEKKAKEEAEANRKKEELKRQQDYILQLARKYGFKPNMTLTEFSSLSGGNYELANTKRDKWPDYNLRNLGSYIIGPYYLRTTKSTNNRDEIVIEFYYRMSNNGDETKFNEISSYVKQNVDKEYLQEIYGGGFYIRIEGVDFEILLRKNQIEFRMH